MCECVYEWVNILLVKVEKCGSFTYADISTSLYSLLKKIYVKYYKGFFACESCVFKQGLLTTLCHTCHKPLSQTVLTKSNVVRERHFNSWENWRKTNL